MLTAQGYTNLITCTHAELDLSRQADVEAFSAQERPEYVFLAAARVGCVRYSVIKLYKRKGHQRIFHASPTHRLRHDETGRLVHCFDVAGLADAVCALLDDPAARQRLGTSTRRFAQANYDVQTVCLPRQLAWVEAIAAGQRR